MKHKFSKETLWHFQCGVCGQWWTIGDFDPKNRLVFCPRCGKLAECEEIEEDEH